MIKKGFITSFLLLHVILVSGFFVISRNKSSFKYSSRILSFSSPNDGSSDNNKNIDLTIALKEQNHFYSQKEIVDVLKDSSSNEKKLFLKLCEAASINRPSRIQSLSWPVLLKRKNSIIAEQSGSGKTLAYLIPILHHIMVVNDSSPSPKIIILTPTSELAMQVSKVCKSISRKCGRPFSTLCITSTDDSTPIRDQVYRVKNLKKNIDVIVSTPGRLATLIKSKAINTLNVENVILDEVDVLLLDESFGPQLRTLGNGLPKSQNATQFLFVTATLPQLVVDKIRQEFQNVQLIKGPGLHRVAPSLKEYLVDVSVPTYQSNRNLQACLEIKSEALLQSLRVNRYPRTLIFCNTISSCRHVENLLKRRDKNSKLWKVNAYHSAMTNHARITSLKQFLTQSNSSTSRKKKQLPFSSEAHILICTDRAARGIDFSGQPIEHVIIFDFPKDPAEYVRRVGRTARAGREGICTVFAYGWQLPLARQIMGKANVVKVNNNLNDEINEENDFVPKNKKERNIKSKFKSQDEVIKNKIEKGVLWRNYKNE